MTSQVILIYMIIFIYGIVIGSFLNVCIYRIPKGENIAKVRSHCMDCGYQLKWYDLIPIFSCLCLGGKCRKCKTHISIQYPMVELANGILYLLVFMVNGFCASSFLYCFLVSALIVISVIDFRTYEIPFGINVFIFILGIIQVIIDYENWLDYLIGFFAVSIFMQIVIWLTKGTGFGGGDMKLMAAAGLLLGWKRIVLAFLLGCIVGSICHVIRMKVTKEDHVLAFGPYLSIGILLAALWGNKMIYWYLSSML
ncbi:MAG: prepilin peptidase [Lachnospiraceae bacterium]|nr:prepilin peptidase [Lachnospiraceae bacterium]